MRERLIELLKRVGDNVMQFKTENFIESLADYLLENGVVVPPVKVGDTLFYIGGIHNTLIKPAKVEELYYNGDGYAFHVCSDNGVYFTVQEEDIFYTREAAENALKKEREKG